MILTNYFLFIESRKGSAEHADDLSDELLLSAAGELEKASVTTQEANLLSGSQGYFIISFFLHFVLALFHLSIMNENSHINDVIVYIYLSTYLFIY